MTTSVLLKLLHVHLDDLMCQHGVWYGARREIIVYVHLDEGRDRVRISTRVGELKTFDPELMATLLQANFDRAIDARYSLREKDLWSLFVHPLSSLSPADLEGFIDQVITLAANTGSTFASSTLRFDSEEAEVEAFEISDNEEEPAPETKPATKQKSNPLDDKAGVQRDIDRLLGSG